MNDEEIEKANRLMISFDNIRKMDDTEIVVFVHNLAHYLYDRTKGELYLIDGKDIKRIENLQERIDKAIDYINNHQLVFQDATKNEIQDWFDMFYKELLDILKGSDNE